MLTLADLVDDEDTLETAVASMQDECMELGGGGASGTARKITSAVLWPRPPARLD